MTSASASSVQKSFKYDVFLSFRGEDTRKNFVDHLYHALTQKGIYTYRDDEEIKKGERISDELIRSINDSKFYIIVFSKNYASSSWCLDELVKIMERQKTNEHTAYPVFYDVEPTEVRKQSGAVEEAFSKLKDKEAAGRWRDALTEAADLAGWELKNIFDGHESKLIKKIVEEISLELRFINSSVDGKLIGMETRVIDVVSSLEIDIEDHVRMIGIWGMGGAGKTTLARAVFDQISFMFEGSSFAGNVREISENPLCGLKSLQKQVLSEVLNDPDITVRGVSDLKRLIRGRKVLVVLDDVDHIDQLEALAGASNWFKAGSRIIITTREEQVLVAHGVPKNLILDVDLLSHEEANCLFNRYAFGRLIPNQGYEELACQVIRYAAGLPLTIKVLGSFLLGKDELEWRDALERLKTLPLQQTLKILELSYNGLEEDHKEIFLDVACILKGWEKEEAIRALESCGFHARSGLKVLEQKSLITSSYGYLDMHDHIEEMGKNIVRRLHPNEPHRHSRLWIKEEIEDILVNNKGTKAIKCIKLVLVNLSVAKKGLQKMTGLRFLKMHHRCDGDCDCNYIGEDHICLPLPNRLRYLSLSNCPFTFFLENFQPKNLVGLFIRHTKVDQHLEAGEKVLKNLRFIDLYECGLSSLNIGLNMNLERLHLKSCYKLVELHMPIESLKLKSLYLSFCELKTLNLKGARNLETLELIGCGDLVELHMPIESLKLKQLSLRCSKLKTLKLMRAPNLERLDLVCEDLLELHMPTDSFKLKSLNLCSSNLRSLNLTQTRNLKKLNLERCEDLLELHMPIECHELKIIYIRCSKLRTLNLTHIRNLEMLDLELCEDLLELHMPSESPKLKIINIRCCKLRTLNLTQTQNLETLDLVQCEDLLELHMPIESPKLKILNIRCSKLRTLNLGLSPYLKSLHLYDCFNLVEIHAPTGCLSGCVRYRPFLVNQGLPMAASLVELHLVATSLRVCPLHHDNDLPKLHFACIYKELLPLWTRNLAKLISSSVCACTNLARVSGVICDLQCLRKLKLEGSIAEVPKEFDQLDCLQELTLLSTKIEHLPDTICMLKQLRFLQLKSCLFLKQLPQDLGRLECLEELRVTDCTSLRDIPNSICEMKRLKRFHLTNCILVEKLPKEIGRLKGLKELHVEGTGISDFPPSIFQLEDLLFLL